MSDFRCKQKNHRHVNDLMRVVRRLEAAGFVADRDYCREAEHGLVIFLDKKMRHVYIYQNVI